MKCCRPEALTIVFLKGLCMKYTEYISIYRYSYAGIVQDFSYPGLLFFFGGFSLGWCAP